MKKKTPPEDDRECAETSGDEETALQEGVPLGSIPTTAISTTPIISSATSTTEAPEAITHDQEELPSCQTHMQEIVAGQLNQSHPSGVMEDRADAAISAAGICPLSTNSWKNCTIPVGTQEVNSIRVELEKIRDRKNRLLQLERLDEEEKKMRRILEGLQGRGARWGAGLGGGENF